MPGTDSGYESEGISVSKTVIKYKRKRRRRPRKPKTLCHESQQTDEGVCLSNGRNTMGTQTLTQDDEEHSSLHCDNTFVVPPYDENEIHPYNQINAFVTFDKKLVGRENNHVVNLNGAPFSCLLDTGSQVSLLSKSMYDRFFYPLPIEPVSKLLSLRGVTGNCLNIEGTVELFVRLGSNLCGTDSGFHVQFMVIADHQSMMKTHGDYFCLIGMNAFEQVWRSTKEEKRSSCMLDFVYSGLTKVAKLESEPVGKLKLHESVTILPGQEAVLKCFFRSKLPGGSKVPVLVEFILEGLDSRDLIVQCEHSPFVKLQVPFTNNSNIPVELDKDLVVAALSVASAPFTIDEDCDISTFSLKGVDEFTQEESFFSQQNHPGLLDTDDDEISPDMKLLYNHVNNLQHLSQADREALLEVIENNLDTFSKSDYDIGKVSGVKHHFVLADDVPFKVRHRNLPPRMYEAAKDHLNQLLAKGIIRPSESPYSSAPMFLKKPDGRVRMVTDLRYLNAKTVRDCYALPRFDDILPYLAGNIYFSKMDIRSGYYNIEVAEGDKPKTAFSTVFGLYEYNRMVQGAKTSAATFQRCMENVLRPMLYQGAIAFLDDVIIYSKSKEEHFELLSKAFKLMADAGLKLHPGKCELLATEITYLGHKISASGVSVDKEKTKVLSEWKVLENVGDVMSFLGFCGYFRRHIPNFSRVAKPLIKLTQGCKYKPKSKFGPPVKQPSLGKSILEDWTPECEEARKELIRILSSPPCLVFPDLDKTFILHVDACTTGLGAVLLQFGNDKLLHPVCYASRSLKAPERNYPPHKLEFLALKWAVVDKFHFYLYGREFKVYTDNNPLTHIHTSLKVDATSQRWLASLGEYDFQIFYKPGTLNIDADILSRMHAPIREKCLAENFCGVLFPTQHVSCFESIENEAFLKISSREVLKSEPEWITCCDVSSYNIDQLGHVNVVTDATDWLNYQLEDSDLVKLRDLLKSGLKLEKSDFPKRYRKLFHMKDRLFFDKCDVLKSHTIINGLEYKVVVLPLHKLPFVLNLLHDDSGHLGVERVCRLFQRRFYLNGYISLIGDWIQSCPRCLCKKSPVHRQAELGRVTASRPFEVLSMDYLKLDKNENGYQKVLVVTDVFTKFSFAFPTKNETAYITARLLVDNIFNVFGIPSKLLSDRGRNFESDVIKQLCDIMGIKKVFTCPYSPKSDAICERFNRTLISMIGTLTKDQRAQWHKYLPHLVSVYNNTQHSSTNFSPYELVFGRKSRLPVDVMLGTTPEDNVFPNVKDYVKQLQTKLELSWNIARENSTISHKSNKDRYDKRVKSTFLKVGDHVLVKNVGIKGEHKLDPIWLPEPYVIIRQIKGNTRVFEVKSLVNPRKKTRVLHIDMLKPLGDFETQFTKSRLPGASDSLNRLGGQELVELFDSVDGDVVPDSSFKKDQAKTSSNQPPVRRSRRLRSKVNGSDEITAEDSDIETDSDDILKSVDKTDESDHTCESETEHAPVEDIEPFPDIEQIPGDGGPNELPRGEGSDNNSNPSVHSDDEESNPELFQSFGEEDPPPVELIEPMEDIPDDLDIELPDGIEPIGDPIITEDLSGVDEAVIEDDEDISEDLSRRIQPDRQAKRQPRQRFDNSYTQVMMGVQPISYTCYPTPRYYMGEGTWF